MPTINHSNPRARGVGCNYRGFLPSDVAASLATCAASGGGAARFAGATCAPSSGVPALAFAAVIGLLLFCRS